MRTCKGCKEVEMRTINEKDGIFFHEIFCKDREETVFRYFSSNQSMIDVPCPDDCDKGLKVE